MSLSGMFGGAQFSSAALGSVQQVMAPSTIPAGFDSVVQFSSRLLQQSLVNNLQSSGLDILSVRVPFQQGLLSPKLAAKVNSPSRYGAVPIAGFDLEVLLIGPTLKNVQAATPSPVSQPITAGGVMASAKKKTTSRSVLQGSRGSADLQWTIQVNLFEATPTNAMDAAPSGGSAAGVGTTGVAGSLGLTPGKFTLHPVAFGPVTGGGLPSGKRTTLAEGTAAMHVPTNLGVTPTLLQIWLELDFQGVQPDYTSTDPALTQFLATDTAEGMLAQAVAPLLNGSAVRLSPTVSLAGNLNAAQIAGMALATLNARELVLQDQSGQVLSFCASLGNDATGVASLVRSFLGGHDFSYYLSEKLFGPILKARWQANAIRIPIVATVSVEMPVNGNSGQMGQGKARVQVSISSTLQQSSLQPSATAMGDPLQLVSQQTVQLLDLWDPNGSQVTNLGSYGAPATEALALSFQMFDPLPHGASQNVQPTMQNFLLGLFTPIYIPLVERFGITNIGGFSSSPLRALIVTWDLKLAPETHIPISGTTVIAAR